jgi:hypothetical protein
MGSDITPQTHLLALLRQLPLTTISRFLNKQPQIPVIRWQHFLPAKNTKKIMSSRRLLSTMIFRQPQIKWQHFLARKNQQKKSAKHKNKREIKIGCREIARLVGFGSVRVRETETLCV